VAVTQQAGSDPASRKNHMVPFHVCHMNRVNSGFEQSYDGSTINLVVIVIIIIIVIIFLVPSVVKIPRIKS